MRARSLRVPRLSLLTRFALLSFVLLALLGVVLANRMTDTIRRRTLDDAVRSAEVVADVGIKPLLRPADLERDFVPLTGDRRAALDDVLQPGVSDDGVVRLKLWNRQHWLVYSDNPRLVGRWFAGNALLRSAFEGKTTSEITDLSAPEEFDERDFGRLLAVYVPLRVDPAGGFTTDASGEVVGAFEIYLPYEPIAAAIADDTLKLSVTLAIGLGVLYLALFRLVSRASRRLRRQAAANEHQATHDSLTGLANRRLLHARAAQLLAARAPEELVMVALLDLDRFKDLNDTLGHARGDDILRVLANRLESHLRGDVTVARLGGDEFGIVVGKLGSVEDARSIVARAVAAIEPSIDIDGIEITVRASAGLAIAPHHGLDADVLLQRADVAMYVAKRGHRPPTVYAPALDHYDPEQLRLAADIRTAMHRDELFLVFQPKVGLRDGRLHGVEALVRWQHPTRGLVGPGEFVPIVEASELVEPFTFHIVDLALAQWRAWRQRGFEIPVAVNFPARVLNDPALDQRLAEMLAAHDAPASSLEIELTESSILVDPDQARSTLAALRERGLRCAIDDFGTGYASLAYLTTLPIDAVKIDQSFVGSMTTDPSAEAVVRFTVDLARHLDLRVVAEGVEDAATLDALAVIGCDSAQGYFIARPATAELLDEWIRTSDYLVPVAAGEVRS